MDSKGVELDQVGTSVRLYRYMADQLHNHGGELPCTLDALEVYAAEPRADINFLKYINLDNRSFLDALYVTCFNFYPPEWLIDMWQDDMKQLPKEEFQEKYITFFIHLREYSRSNVRMRNCPYELRSATNWYGADLRTGFGAGFRKWTYQTFLPLFKRLPESLKNKIRKRFWKYYFVR